MKPRQITARLLPSVVALGILAVMAVWPVDSFSQEAGPTPPIEAGRTPHMHFGMVGLVQGQTARLSVGNTGVDNPDYRRCSVRLMFFNDQGRLVGVDNPDLRPGASAFLDVAIDDPNIRPGQRLQFSASVRLVDNPDFRGGTCAFNDYVATLEVFDKETGKTMLILNPGVLRGFNPQPDPPGIPILER